MEDYLFWGKASKQRNNPLFFLRTLFFHLSPGESQVKQNAKLPVLWCAKQKGLLQIWMWSKSHYWPKYRLQWPFSQESSGSLVQKTQIAQDSPALWQKWVVHFWGDQDKWKMRTMGEIRWFHLLCSTCCKKQQKEDEGTRKKAGVQRSPVMMGATFIGHLLGRKWKENLLSSASSRKTKLIAEGTGGRLSLYLSFLRFSLVSDWL